MIERVLVAVEDTAPALAAVRFGIRLAALLGATLGFVSVTVGARDPEPVLRHAAALAAAAGVTGATTLVQADSLAYRGILTAATDWRADLLVVGRSARRPSGRPYVGSQTEHVLEFAEVPVVVVPTARPDRQPADTPDR